MIIYKTSWLKKCAIVNIFYWLKDTFSNTHMRRALVKMETSIKQMIWGFLCTRKHSNNVALQIEGQDIKIILSRLREINLGRKQVIATMCIGVGYQNSLFQILIWTLKLMLYLVDSTNTGLLTALSESSVSPPL